MDVKGITEIIDSIPSRTTLYRLFSLINLLCVTILTKYSVDFMVSEQLLPSSLDFTSIINFVLGGKILIPVLTFILIWVMTRIISTKIGQSGIKNMLSVSSEHYPEIDIIKKMSINEQKKYFKDNSNTLIVKIFMPLFDNQEIEHIVRSNKKSKWISLLNETKGIVLISFDPLIRILLCSIVVYFCEPVFPTFLFALVVLFVIVALVYALAIYVFTDILTRYILSYEKEANNSNPDNV